MERQETILMTTITMTKGKDGALMAAHNQWMKRPDDERFATIADLLAHEAGRADRSAVVRGNYGTLRAVATEGNGLALMGNSGRQVRPSSWAFGQLAARVGAPAAYLQTLPSTVAADALNHGLAERTGSEAASLLVEFDERRGQGAPLLRAFTSGRYARVWNHELASACAELQAKQPCWTEPTAFMQHGGGTAAGAWGESIKLPAAFAGDRDCFIFLCDYTHGVQVPGQDHPLARGFFLENSEVGAASLRLTLFAFDFACSNMIVWGAKDVTEISIRHIGSIRDRVLGADSDVMGALSRWTNAKASEQEAQIISARTKLLGDTKDEVVTAVHKRIRTLPQKAIGAAFDTAEKVERYGNPHSIWGIVNGLTETSQTEGFAGDRVAIDRAAGEVLSWAF
jgi:hypothetical protein